MKGRLTAFLFVLAFSVSCGNEAASVLLDDVESFIQERPDSALATLRTIDATTLVGKAQRAKYSLLYSIALDKNYIDTTDISVIQPALEYYSGRNEHRYKKLALYYTGKVFYNAKDYSNAILHYLQAAELNDNNNYLNGLIYAAISDAYNANYNSEEELRYVIKAHAFFEALGDKDHLNLSRFKIARAYHNCSYYDIADSLYSALYPTLDSTSNLSFLTVGDLVDNDILRENPDVKRDLDLLKRIMANGAHLSLREYYQYAYLLLLDGNIAGANSIISQLSSLDGGINTLSTRYRIALYQGNSGDALRYLQELTKYQNDVVKEQLKQSLFKAQSDYYQLSAAVSEQKTTIANQRSILITAFCALSLFLMFLAFRYRRRRLMTENGRLLLDVSRRKQDNEELRIMYITLFREQFKEMISTGSFDSLRLEISQNANWQKKFENKINDGLDGIVAKIRKDFPKFTNDDIRFICYVLAGFDSSAIAFLMDMSKDNVRQKTSRIRKRIAKYSGPNAPLYDACLRKT